MSALKKLLRKSKSKDLKSVSLSKRELEEEIVSEEVKPLVTDIIKPSKVYISKLNKVNAPKGIKGKFKIEIKQSFKNIYNKIYPYSNMIISDIYYLLTRKELKIEDSNKISIEDLYE